MDTHSPGVQNRFRRISVVLNHSTRHGSSNSWFEREKLLLVVLPVLGLILARGEVLYKYMCYMANRIVNLAVRADLSTRCLDPGCSQEHTGPLGQTPAQHRNSAGYRRLKRSTASHLLV